MRQQLAAHRLDEAGDRPFRCRIDRLDLDRRVTRDRTGDEDVARAALDHVRGNGLHVLHHRIDVQRHHPVDGLGGGRAQIAADIGAGVATQDVQMPDLVQDLRHHGVAAVGIQQVGHLGDGLGAQFGHQVVQRLFVAVHHHDAGPFVQQRAGRRKADPRGRARDRRDLAVQCFGHVSLLLFADQVPQVLGHRGFRRPESRHPAAAPRR